jgi:hypothetical protein
MSRASLVFVAGMAIGGAAVQAHHSIAAVYDNSRRTTIDGVVAQFALVSPHPFLLIDVKAAQDTERWRGEMDNLRELAGIGVTQETLKPGDRVVVTGSLSRTQPRSFYIARLDRPADRFWYEQVGGSPRVGTK